MFQDKLSKVAQFSSLAVALGAATMPAVEAEGALVKDLNVSGNLVLNAAQQFQDYVVTYEVVLPSGEKRRPSGVLFDPWTVIASAHGIPSATSASIITSATTSLDINNPLAVGTTVAVESWKRYEGYISGNTSTLDIAVIKLSGDGFLNEITANGLRPLTLNFADPVSSDDIVWIAGTGKFGDVINGLSESDGKARAGRGPIPFGRALLGSYSPEFYRSIEFFEDISDPLNIKATNSYSGGGALTQDLVTGEFKWAGTLVFQGGAPDGYGVTGFAFSWNDDFRNFVLENAGTTSEPPGGNSGVPEPSTALLFGGVIAAVAGKRRRASRK